TCWTEAVKPTPRGIPLSSQGDEGGQSAIKAAYAANCPSPLTTCIRCTTSSNHQLRCRIQRTTPRRRQWGILFKASLPGFLIHAADNQAALPSASGSPARGHTHYLSSPSGR